MSNETKIVNDEQVELLRGAIGHRAIWMGLIYAKAAEDGKATEAEQFIRAAISTTGITQGNAIKAKCTNPDSCSSLFDAMFSQVLQKTFEVEIKEKQEDKLALDFHYCPLLAGWQAQGIDSATCAKLCDMAMDGDRNIAKAMGMEFTLGDTIAGGCKTCQITFAKK